MEPIPEIAIPEGEAELITHGLVAVARADQYGDRAKAKITGFARGLGMGDALVRLEQKSSEIEVATELGV